MTKEEYIEYSNMDMEIYEYIIMSREDNNDEVDPREYFGDEFIDRYIELRDKFEKEEIDEYKDDPLFKLVMSLKD